MKRFMRWTGVMGLMLVGMTAMGQLLVPNTRTNYVLTVTNLPSSIAAGGSLDVAYTGATNIVSQTVKILPGYGLGVQVSFTNASSGATSNVTFKVNLTVASGNWQKTPPFTIVVASAGNSAARFFTNLPASSIDGAYGARLESISSGDSANALGAPVVIFSRAMSQ